MRTLSIIALLSLIAALLSFSAFGAAQPAVKPNQLPEITNSQLSATDLFLLFDSSAGRTKKLALSEMDTRYGGGGAGGDVDGPGSSVDSQFALFNSTTGKLIKAATGTGVCKATSGVASFAALVNADISASAAIAFSKMAALTASRVAVTDGSGFVSAGSQTTTELALLTSATDANTAGTLVKRDGSGNFSGGTFTGAVSGNASTASALASNPTDCGAGEFANAIAANGNLTCATPSASAAWGSITGNTAQALPSGGFTGNLVLNNATDGFSCGTGFKLWNDTSGAVMSSTGPIFQALPASGQVHFFGFGTGKWRWANSDINTMSLDTTLLTLLNNQPIRFGAGATLVEFGKIGASDPRLYFSTGTVNGPILDINNGVFSGYDGASPGSLTLRGGNASGSNDGGDLTIDGGSSGSGQHGQVKAPSGVSITTTVSKPTCNSSRRGQFWIVQGGAGVADVPQICMKDAADAYAWKTITTS